VDSRSPSPFLDYTGADPKRRVDRRGEGSIQKRNHARPKDCVQTFDIVTNEGGPSRRNNPEFRRFWTEDRTKKILTSASSTAPRRFDRLGQRTKGPGVGLRRVVAKWGTSARASVDFFFRRGIKFPTVFGQLGEAVIFARQATAGTGPALPTAGPRRFGRLHRDALKWLHPSVLVRFPNRRGKNFDVTLHPGLRRAIYRRDGVQPGRASNPSWRTAGQKQIRMSQSAGRRL